MTQEQALTILKTGANVFLTGEPGSGKTHTINLYTEWLRSKDIYPAVTASTGIAATHINGKTIHSWAGIGTNKNLTEAQQENIMDRPWIYDPIRKAKVLIIDEISMLEAVTLDDVEHIVSRIRIDICDGVSAFGGMQVIFVGDLFQLPPVPSRGEPPPKFCYESEAWKNARPYICYLHEQHRQEDPEFLEALTAMRSGTLTKIHESLLHGSKKNPEQEKFITKLYTHRVKVDSINERDLDRLPGIANRYTMSSSGVAAVVDSLKKGCLSPEILRLKKGALVMFTKNNFDEGYANGTLGEIVDFTENDLPIVKTKNKKITVRRAEWSIMEENRIVASVSQLPLRLAWAMTVHKSQGMTLDRAVIDLSEAFEFGQGYVALSRVRSLADLSLQGLNTRALEMHPEIVKQDVIFRKESDEMTARFAALPKDRIAKMEKDFIVSLK